MQTNIANELICFFLNSLGKLWEQHEDAKRAAVHEAAHERVCGLLTDSEPEVRAAAVWALAAYFGG